MAKSDEMFEACGAIIQQLDWIEKAGIPSLQAMEEKSAQRPALIPVTAAIREARAAMHSLGSVLTQRWCKLKTHAEIMYAEEKRSGAEGAAVLNDNGRWVSLTNPDDVLQAGDQVRYRMVDMQYDHWQLVHYTGATLGQYWGNVMSGDAQFRRWIPAKMADTTRRSEQ